MNEVFWQKAQEFEKSYWIREKINLEDSAAIKAHWISYLKRHDLSLSSWKDMNILEIGCGPKGLIYYCEAKQKIGLDPLATFYSDNYSIDQKVNLLRGKAENLPFEDSYFDCVFLINVLDHTENPKLAIDELIRVLNPSGYLLFHVELDSPIKSFIRAIFNKEHIIGHPHSLKKINILNFIDKNKFDILSYIDKESVSIMLINSLKSRQSFYYLLLYLPDNLLYHLNKNLFSTSIYIYAIKR